MTTTEASTTLTELPAEGQNREETGETEIALIAGVAVAVAILIILIIVVIILILRYVSIPCE